MEAGCGTRRTACEALTAHPLVQTLRVYRQILVIDWAREEP